VPIEKTAGSLTDHYDPKENVIRLSESVYGAHTAAAVGVAAHEAGHAVQYALGYSPIRLRQTVIPVTKIGTYAAWPLFIIGMLMSVRPLQLAGIILFSACVLFQLLTLPVEINASRRATAALRDSGISEEGLKAAKSVLTAAALTYVAALASAVANLLRLLLLFRSGRSRR
jgi:Zn-dependent membrane protease YugP